MTRRPCRTPAAGLWLVLALVFPAAALAGLQSALRDSTNAYVRGDYREAARVLEAALATEPAPGPELTPALSALGTLQWLQGRYADAERSLRRVVALTAATRGKEDPEVARELSRLGGVLRAQGRYREAESVYWRAIRVLEPQYGVDHAYVAECLYHLAELSRLQRRYAEAESRYWRAYMIRTYLFGRDSSPVGEAMSGLAAVYRAQGRDAEAQDMYGRALRIAEKPPRSNHAWGRLDERDLRELNPAERETVSVKGRIFTKEGSPRHLEFAQHYEALGNLYRAHARWTDAEHMYRKAIAIRERAFGMEHPEVAQALSNVALVHKEQGNVERGLESVRTASRVLGRRIAALERPEYAQGERRRWQPVFLLELALLTSSPASAKRLGGEAFAAIQYAQLAGAEAPVSIAEAQKLLAPGEVLVVATVDEDEAYVAILRKDSAEARRLAVGELSGVLTRELAGMRGLLVAPDLAPEPIAGAVRLPSVGSLRARARQP